MKYTYDLNSRQITATNALNQTTSYEYDKNNRLLKTIDPAGDSKSQSYNNQGSQDSATDGLGNTTHYAYDGQDRLIRVTLPNGESTTYTYDNAGNVLTMTDAAGNVTTYEYNYANLLIRLIRVGGRTGEPGSFVYDFSKITSYTYTADGRVSTITDRNGAVTVCVYDIHGNLLSRTVTEGGSTQSVSYTYDSNGNVLTMTDGTGTTTRTYDAWNRTTAKTVPHIGTSFYTYDITDGFDAGCSAESTVDPKGNVTVKVYDRVGRLIYVLADSMTTSYAYYADGSLQSVVYGNGSREDYTYTADKLLKTLVNKAIDGTIIDSYEYTYDSAHNLLSKTDSKGVTGYTYDAQNRLLTVTEPSGKITAYTYDAAGNRSSQTETKGSDVTVTVYTYDALNRLICTTETLNGTLARTVDYTYDNNGNLLTVTSVTYIEGIAGEPVLEQSNTYDLLNQLIRTVTSDGTTVENTYNGDGYRVVKSVNGSATMFLYQYDKIVLEVNALGDQTGRNVYGLNLISRTFGEDTFFYFYNGHADVTALLALDGTIAATYYYDAFGNILDQTGTATSNILYAGYQYDPETGLYYLNARMYDPVTARFIQEDSYLGERNNVLSLNLYTYCHNEPMMYSDPSGHREVEGTEIGDHPRKRKSATLDDYEYQTRTKATQTRLENLEKETKAIGNSVATAAKNATDKVALQNWLIDPNVDVYDDKEKILIAENYLREQLDQQGGSINMRYFYDGNATNEQKATLGALIKLTNGQGIKSLEQLLTHMENVRGRSDNDAFAPNCDTDNLMLDEEMYQLIVSDSQQLWATMYSGTAYGDFLKFTTENTFAISCAATTIEGASYAIIGIGGSGIQAESNIVEQDYIDAQVAQGNIQNSRSPQTPVSGSEWNEYFCETYGAENVEWETKPPEVVESATGKGANNPLVLRNH